MAKQVGQSLLMFVLAQVHGLPLGLLGDTRAQVFV